MADRTWNKRPKIFKLCKLETISSWLKLTGLENVGRTSLESIFEIGYFKHFNSKKKSSALLCYLNSARLNLHDG